MFTNALAVDDKENARLFQRMKNRVEIGVAQQEALIQRVSSMIIRDKLVPPTDMKFQVDTENNLEIRYGSAEQEFRIHKHALTQLAQKVNIPLTYVSYLGIKQTKEYWKPTLLADILQRSFTNTAFPDKAGKPRFLHRIVGNELRGFLSRRFNRHIASAPLLRSYLEVCAEVGALPFDAVASDIKVALKCLLPYIFEPVKGEFLCVGVEWSNSDFGAGRMQVALSMWMPRGDRFTVLDHVVSRVHIGSIIEETDIDISEETAKKEAEAQASAIQDTVRNQLSQESVDRLLKAVEMAHEEKIEWHALKGQLARFLSKKDIDSLKSLLEEDVIDLPPVKTIDGDKVPSKWWATQALSWLANRTEDAEAKLSLQHAAGSFVEVK
jgi:hypothetical protein